MKEQLAQQKRRRPPQRNSPPRGKRSAPPDHTNAESFYYLKQMQNQTPMVVVLTDGEEVQGTIEWYDRACLKVRRDGDANLLIYKESIKYLYKSDEAQADDTQTAPEEVVQPNGSAEPSSTDHNE